MVSADGYGADGEQYVRGAPLRDGAQSAMIVGLAG
jgi:hypothetical protein